MNSKILQTILIFFVFGLVAGFLSLILMTLLPVKLASNETVVSIALLAFLEEVVKYSLLYFIFSTHTLNNYHWGLSSWIFPIFLGAGFSSFELTLIFFQQTNLPLAAFLPTIIHITSAILLTNAIKLLYQKTAGARAVCLLLLAVFIHICYNIVIVKII